MSRAFADITFTPSVKTAQSMYGSREANEGFEYTNEKRDHLEPRDIEFIAQRDSFYQATISENAWPYVQHRGGPAGFLKALDKKTLGYADLSGNAQYLSVGNLFANNRVAIILMDYANRRRLKVWGRVKIVHEHEQPDLIEKLRMPGYRAQIERAIVITVDAIEWNCPQHITPRFTEHEVQGYVSNIVQQNQRLKEQLKELKETLDAEKKAHSTRLTTPTTSVHLAQLGNGPLPLVVTGVRQLTPNVRSFELRHPENADLPIVEAGSHLSIPVLLANGETEIRQYSISSNPSRCDAYEIAVLRDDQGRGGSVAAYQNFQIGLHLNCEMPRNDFPLHKDDKPTVLIAGGIGITPLKSMALALKSRQTPFVLHYAAQNLAQMAYRNQLQRALGSALRTYSSADQKRIDVLRLLQEAPNETLFYVCGPARLIEAVLVAAKTLGIPPERVRYEHFSALKSTTDKAFTVELQRSKIILQVKADQSILQAARAAGIDAPAQCEVGNCGTCAVKVIEGAVDHRDAVLNEDQKEEKMCICVSRAQSASLILDL
jgi:hypothetical protein